MRWFILGLLGGVMAVVSAPGRLVIGGRVWDAAALEKHRQLGETMDLTLIGGLVIAKDVSPELAAATIGRLRVIGGCVLPKPVAKALAGRITIIGGMDAG